MWVKIVVVAVVVCTGCNPSRGDGSGYSKAGQTKMKLMKYAYEAYPTWSAAHPDIGCPDKLSDLNEYMNDSDTNDAWGLPIKMMCGSGLPADARGFATVSTGEDGKEGTEDDLKSWE